MGFKFRKPKHIDMKYGCECGDGYLIVTDSRIQEDYVRRRKKCVQCGMVFTTIEVNADCIVEADRQIGKLNEIASAIVAAQKILKERTN